jgi:hypothetical protein
MKIKIYRWPVLLLGCGGVLAGLFQLGVVRATYETDAVLTYKGELKKLPALKGVRVERSGGSSVRVIAQGNTAGAATQAVQAATSQLSTHSLEKKKTTLQQKATALKNRQRDLSGLVSRAEQERQYALKGNRRPWTPAMAQRLKEAQERFRALQAYPTHTDIPILAQEIKSLEAAQRGQTKVDKNRVADLSKHVVEARVELRVLATRIAALEKLEKAMRSDWTVVRPAAKPTRPVQVPGWPYAAGTVLITAVLGWVLGKKSSSGGHASSAVSDMIAAKIPLAIAGEEPEALPDDPMSRKAAALYDRWLELVKVVYATGPAAPKNIFADAEPLYKETVEFLKDGHDILTRLLARVVIPGDLHSHVARTVLMALMGAHEAGATSAQQQGMTFAALFHDLAVAPRPAQAWAEIGSEVGRLSSGLLRKIPNIPTALVMVVEDILVAMDEYPLATWQNVTRSENVASFAKLLRHIDHFDKVLQKQKTRLNRRIAA